MPLRLLPADDAPAEVQSAAMDESGAIRVRLTRAGRMADLRPGALRLLDAEGRPVECEARISSDGATLILSPHRSFSKGKVVWGDRESIIGSHR